MKISVIGAGSAVFSLNLVRDICLTPSLAGSTICLMDISRERLDMAYGLCRRYSEEVGARLKIEKTMDRREALREADVVVNTALAAGHGRLQEGWRIAEELGYRFGGSLHVMHDEAFWINYYQFRLFLSVADDVLDLCPDAWYVQLANPVFAGITLLHRLRPELKAVGLCHGYYGGLRAVLRVLGLRWEEIEAEAPGVNHFIWLTKLYRHGEDAMPLLHRWAVEEAPRHWETCPPSSATGPKAVDLYLRLEAFPIGDTCTPGGGSWGWWYHVDDETEKRWKENPSAWWKRYFKGLEEKLCRLKAAVSDHSKPLTSIYPPEKSRGIIVPVIESLLYGVERVVQVNIPNTGGLVPGVPEDIAVEVPAVVSRNGVRGVQTGRLPRKVLAYLLRDRVAAVEAELEAFLASDRDGLVQLVLMDPWTRSLEQAEKLVDKILSMPIHAEMKKHYR